MRLKHIILITFLSICSMLVSTTYHIKLDGTGDFTTIQAGIDASVDSDTVLVYSGTYFENLDFIGKNIILCSQELTTGNSQFINSTIIDGQRLGSCIRVHNGESNARVSGFTLQNGFGTQFWSRDGGAVLVHNYSTVYITNCTITNNIAELGAGLYARHGTIHVSGVNIFGNSASLGGAIYLADNSTIQFDFYNRCNIYNNNAGKGTDIYAEDTGHTNVIVDTFSVFNPSRYFAEYLDGATLGFDIQSNWMELEPNDLYVAFDGNDTNTGLSPDEPLRNISWAVRKIQAEEQNPRTIHVAAGIYSWENNQQVYPIGCKEYVSIIGEGMDNTILFNDFTTVAVMGFNLSGSMEISHFSISNSSEMHTADVLFLRTIDLAKLSYLKIQNNSNIRRIILTEFVNNIFDNLIISDNVADRNAALSLEENAGIMKNCLIKNNSLTQSADGNETVMQLDAFDDFTIENCIFSDNHASDINGRILRVTSGWGIESNIRFINCLFSDNTITSTNVMDVFCQGITEFNNCTFINNSSSSSTIKSYADLTLNNTIMHNDTNQEIYMVDYEYVSGETYNLNVNYSNIKNGELGIVNENNANTINWNEGNIETDPQFLLSENNPYQLTELSPCIDAGSPDTTGLFLPPWDLLHHQRVWDGDGNGTAIIDMGCYEFGADSVGIQQHEIPLADYELKNYPNPFNPETTISFNILEQGKVELAIYNIKGQRIKTLLNNRLDQGRHEVTWNGEDDRNAQVGSGVYFYNLKTKNQTIVKKMILLK